MALSKVGGPRFEVERFDGRTDYLLWERQVKNVFKAMGLGKVLKPKPLNVDDKDWNEIQDQTLSIVTLYLKPNVLKQVDDLETVTTMFQALQAKYHMKELSNRLFTSLKLMSFKIMEGTKIQDHIDAFNDLLVDLLNLGNRGLSSISRLPSVFFLIINVMSKDTGFGNPVGGKLIVSRDVSFNEFSSSKEGDIINPATNEGHSSSPNTIEGGIYHEISHDGAQGGASQMTDEAEEQDFALEEVHEEQHIAGEPPPEPAHCDQLVSSTARPTRVRRAPERYGTWFPREHAVRNVILLVDDLGEALITEDGSLYSSVESQSVPEKLDWDAAMRKKMKSLHDNQTWKLVELSNKKRAIDCKWVYTMKDVSTNAVEKIFKARLVAKGFEQRKSIDYTEVFSPVAKFSTICLCALVTLFALFLDQMDVVTAFLHGALNKVIYMRQPEDFLKRVKERLVCRLLKSLYELKQSPRQWNKRFDEFMHTQGFIQSAYDPCVYMKRVSFKDV
ncbi:hypothetical protein AXG93_4525s1100 [Marchantia polymorpha subsp. ruderalis]|uniref:Reverse transcriptase Ty1/copia-type domain-containing protein n=1 Tax=Marchantia polymorpha subsp. ruderalis TaxID=1480154 RepID=A0A176WGM3_MARPO|nr:hypothetical protein AXG93_4525s1100 [Marchantia polymorpha subsp. ruderalis]